MDKETWFAGSTYEIWRKENAKKDEILKRETDKLLDKANKWLKEGK